MRIAFKVEGRPASAGSKSIFINKKTGKPIVAPACKSSKNWMKQVKLAAQCAYKGKPTELPIHLHLRFEFVRPKRHFGTGRNKDVRKNDAPICHIVKPDLTKIVRAVEDALTGVIWKDDCQVVAQYNTKAYGEKEGVLVLVEIVEP